MNLPRLVRFKRENIIIVGLIPGPSEPPGTINTYLSPLVEIYALSGMELTWKPLIVENSSFAVHCCVLDVICLQGVKLMASLAIPLILGVLGVTVIWDRFVWPARLFWV